VTIPGPDPFDAPTQGAEIRDDPFARAHAREAGEASGRLPAGRGAAAAGRLAQRDPHAAAEESESFPLSEPTSLDDLLRRARLRGFLAGALVTAALVAGGAAVASWWTRPPQPAAAEAEPRLAPPEAQVTAPPGPVEVPPPAPAGRHAAAAPAVPAPHLGGRRRAPAAALRAAGPLVLPAFDLRAPGPPARVDPAPAASRGLELADVSAALDARRGDLESCTADHAADSAAASGRRFHLVLTVAGSGRVSDASLDDAEVGATALGACLVALGREIAFSPFDGEPVRVELPLRLAGQR
jgi:hypothetical protein